jgi:hypothetical protein
MFLIICVLMGTLSDIYGYRDMEGSQMTSNVICFILGTVFPLATVGWLFVH